MLRSALALFIVAAVGSGCAPGCSSSATFSGRTYSVFANPVSFEIENGVLTEAPDFYSYDLPANGSSNWTFAWGGSDTGPVDITIDGTTYSGNGEWDTVECGHLLLDFEGTFETEDGARHVFSAAGNLTIWQDKLAGLLIWNESFTLPGDETGSWRGSSHLDGTLVSGV